MIRFSHVHFRLLKDYEIDIAILGTMSNYRIVIFGTSCIRNNP